MTVTEKAIRTAVADYMRAEGCSCCRDSDRHEAATAQLAKLLRVPKYDDESGFNFAKFRTKPRVSDTRRPAPEVEK